MLDKDIIYDIEALEKNYNNFEFGCYLRNIRKAQKISVRQLAKAVNKTATYLSDIENGNNKPPNKDLLEEIIKELHIDDYPKLKNNLFDLAALEKNDIPSDIKEYLMKNRPLLTKIRLIKDSPESDILLSKILEITY